MGMPISCDKHSIIEKNPVYYAERTRLRFFLSWNNSFLEKPFQKEVMIKKRKKNLFSKFLIISLIKQTFDLKEFLSEWQELSNLNCFFLSRGKILME